MKASLILALCLVCVAGHAKVLDAPRSTSNPNSVETELANSQPVTDTAGPPSQTDETAPNEGMVQVGALPPESARAASVPQPVTAPSLPPDGSTQLVQGLLKERNFSVQTAVLWCMTALGLGILGLMVWRGAILVYQRYTEYREMELFQRPQVSAKNAGAADTALEEEQAAQPEHEPIADSIDQDPESSTVVVLDTRTDRAIGDH